MNIFDKGLSRYMNQEHRIKLSKVCIGIAGCGGLGSNVAMALIRSGFLKFVLVDFDRVEPSNLNRQYFFVNQVGHFKTQALAQNMRAVNPACCLNTYEERVDTKNIISLFKNCDAVVEAFDSAVSKALLVEHMSQMEIFTVAASGIAGYGNVENIHIRSMSNLAIVGDGISQCSPDTPPFAPKVGAVAAFQADIILNYFLKQDKSLSQILRS